VKDIQAKFAALDEVKNALAEIKAKLEANDPGDTDPAAVEPVAVTADLDEIKAQVSQLAAANQMLATELASIKAKGPVTAPKANGIDTLEAALPKSKQEVMQELWAAEQARKMAEFKK
jgi:predicted RNase H-like nuclease (RuvC/YqgF family)